MDEGAGAMELGDGPSPSFPMRIPGGGIPHGISEEDGDDFGLSSSAPGEGGTGGNRNSRSVGFASIRARKRRPDGVPATLGKFPFACAGLMRLLIFMSVAGSPGKPSPRGRRAYGTSNSSRICRTKLLGSRHASPNSRRTARAGRAAPQ